VSVSSRRRQKRLGGYKPAGRECVSEAARNKQRNGAAVPGCLRRTAKRRRPSVPPACADRSARPSGIPTAIGRDRDRIADGRPLLCGDARKLARRNPRMRYFRRRCAVPALVAPVGRKYLPIKSLAVFSLPTREPSSTTSDHSWRRLAARRRGGGADRLANRPTVDDLSTAPGVVLQHRDAHVVMHPERD
jgi:hypothetical protein